MGQELVQRKQLASMQMVTHVMTEIVGRRIVTPAGAPLQEFCTQAFCVNIGQDIRSESTIFREDINKDVSRTAQCNQGGVSKCRAVTVNSDFLVNQLQIGEFVKFLPSINISMKLRRPPTGSVSNTLSYSFSLSDGGEASLTIRPRSNSVFASIRPITGSVNYSVESCGSNCNVLYERDINYFNQFQD